METLRREKLEAERRVEEERKEERKAEEQRKEDERIVKELQEQEEAAEHKQLADLKEVEDKEREKEKEKEDEANEVALQAADAPSVSDGDSEMDPEDLKMAAMAELRRRHKITKGKKKADAPEPHKCKVQSASMVEDSEAEAGGASVGPLAPKCLKTEPVPWAEDKVFSGHGA